MHKILVVEDHEPEMRLMVWHLTDDGSRVKVTTTIGEVISDIETFGPDTVVFNSRALGDAKDACVALIRRIIPDVRIIDVSTPTAAGDRQLIDITDKDEGDPGRETTEDCDFTGAGLIYMVNHRRTG
jgi:DNA-binding response OmpR family regulator